MKINQEFVLRQIADEFVLVPIGKTALEFNGIITINEVGAFIWKLLSEEKTTDEIIESILDEYEIDKAIVDKDVHRFIDYLIENNIIEKNV